MYTSFPIFQLDKLLSGNSDDDLVSTILEDLENITRNNYGLRSGDLLTASAILNDIAYVINDELSLNQLDVSLLKYNSYNMQLFYLFLNAPNNLNLYLSKQEKSSYIQFEYNSILLNDSETERHNTNILCEKQFKTR